MLEVKTSNAASRSQPIVTEPDSDDGPATKKTVPTAPPQEPTIIVEDVHESFRKELERQAIIQRELLKAEAEKAVANQTQFVQAESEK